jgi:hypothetical protein
MRVDLTVDDALLRRIFAHCLPNGECLEWQSARTRAGYGELMTRGVMTYAHRLVAIYCYGPPETWDGPQVNHHCDNPPCCNPAHLYPGTHRHNVTDSWVRGRAKKPPVHSGEAHSQARLTSAGAAEIKVLYREGWTISALSRRFSVARFTIRAVVTGKTWKNT